ncbi:hypothetical protein Clacol_010538 [Clathrus columnatus]|uniref:MARVEL domain-containing protein n=1 Tax=Clathrus columnatus TaxID=1419009 RepID=A0AAV5AR44_9AGAM|nr:hypothetical protein Clacol_010538 [Clathrus columnatus]
MALSAARLSYTEHIPRGDPLNGGHDFSDPSVIALLFSSLLALIFAPFMIYTLYTQWIHPFLTLVYVEVIASGIIWLFWLGSTAAATNVWPDLSFCDEFRACTNLQAMIAFGWLGWITLTILLLFTVVTANRTNAWNDHVHESWSDKPLFPTTGKGFAPGPPPAMHNPRFDRPSAAYAV